MKRSIALKSFYLRDNVVVFKEHILVCLLLSEEFHIQTVISELFCIFYKGTVMISAVLFL